MSSYFALHRISQELRSMLWNAFDQALADDPLFTLDVIKEMTDITFNNPKETAENHDQFRLSLWLYQITEN